MRCSVSRASALTLALAWSSAAQAGGFAFPTFGAEHGHPTTENATAIYYNPGALTQAHRTHLFVDGTLVMRKAGYEHDAHPTDDVPAGLEGANTGKAELFNLLVSPFVGLTTKIGEDLTLAAGAYAPLGGGARWDSNQEFADNPSLPGPRDGVQRWFNISGNITSLYISGAAAYELSERFSIGVSGNAILTEVDETRARTARGDNTLSTEGRSFFEVSGWQWSIGAGLLWEAKEDKLWLGASYQSAPNGDGKMQLDGKNINAFPPAGPRSPTKVELHQRYPDIFRAGGRYRPKDRIEIRLFGDYERWSLLREQCLSLEDDLCRTDAAGANENPGTQILQNAKRDWNDTFAVRAGVSWWTSPSEKIELYAGLGFDSNAAPDSTNEPGLADHDKISAAAGGRFALGHTVHLSATYTYVHLLERTITNSQTSNFVDATRVPDASGTYTGFIGFANVGLEVIF